MAKKPSQAVESTLPDPSADPSSLPRTMSQRPWFVAGLVFVIALTLALAVLPVLSRPDPAATFQTIQPGMSYNEVKAVLSQRHVAGHRLVCRSMPA
jgi:hypothetical protein